MPARLALPLALVASLIVVAAVRADSPRPNVVLIVIDDLGWADLGCYGSAYHETPNIDALARRGLRFTNAYAACPVCSPSRAALHTAQARTSRHTRPAARTGSGAWW